MLNFIQDSNWAYNVTQDNYKDFIMEVVIHKNRCNELKDGIECKIIDSLNYIDDYWTVTFTDGSSMAVHDLVKAVLAEDTTVMNIGLINGCDDDSSFISNYICFYSDNNLEIDKYIVNIIEQCSIYNDIDVLTIEYKNNPLIKIYEYLEAGAEVYFLWKYSMFVVLHKKELFLFTTDKPFIKSGYKLFANSTFKEINLKDVDFSKCSNMNSMFENNFNLVKLNVTSWNFDFGTSASKMFRNCKKLRMIDFPISKCLNTGTTFKGCIWLEEQIIAIQGCM